jgi:hypothetical protein
MDYQRRTHLALEERMCPRQKIEQIIADAQVEHVLVTTFPNK